ncbi:autotransporter outer membrane beta-barrel domain-containing protein [Pseudomonas sp. SWRI154]|uniref:autotransporter outer membrane beta-barrel domain-containing protein n=1 Tax=Pseudomonas sp. SWRI154 TaxID=2745501 RepID=UPI001647DCF7|nr:autotransporter outer membrane beta-barrel domain-containing protein [Pseudomonas sp. SWRI154]MBC3363569.1 autotransporter outer membrane beta-barrel domain-containing protein [Pseudomonas sp. SWRI154]
MPTQHVYLPHHLALAIALALGCAEVSMAQSVADQARSVETTAQMQARLKAFATTKDTKIDKITTAREAALSKGDDNDLVILKSGGQLIGITDGGGGINVLQLDNAKGGESPETRNFQDLHVKPGEWSNSRVFSGNSLIDPKAKLINTGAIGGAVHVLGEFTNQGTVAGPVFVGKNAKFSGNGTVDALDVAGLMEVGPEVGAPSITNDLKFSKSAMLVYGIDAEKGSATIKVGGTATLGNATLKITSLPGESVGQSKHVVIKATKIDGEFGKVINELALVTATPDYTTGTEVGLALTLKKVTSKEITPSKNGQEVLDTILEQKHGESTPTDPVGALPIGELSATKSQTSLSASNSTKPLKVAVSAKPNAAINALLGTSMATAADAIDQLGGYDTADLGNATLSSVAPISSGILSAMSRNTPTGAPHNGQVWVQAIGNSGSLAKQLGSFSLKHSTKGLMLGTDWAISPEWRLGLIGSKTQTRMDSYQFDGALDSWLAGAYALRQDGPLALRLGAVYGSHDGNTDRHVAFNGFRDRLKGRYDATTQQVFGQVGYNLDVGHFDIEPYVQVGYQRYQRDAYTEKGGDAALQYNSQAQDHYSSDLGLRLARSFMFDRGMRLTPRLDVGWKHLYGDVRGTSAQRMASGSGIYTVKGIELDRDSLLLDAGLDLAVSPRHTLGLSYRGETGQDNRNGALMGQWRMMF